MKIRDLFLSMSVMAAFGGGCVLEVATRNAYEGCSSGDSCGGGTSCAPATNSVNSQAYLCTATCSLGTVCPAYGSGSIFPPTCVINGATGLGQCYDTCGSDADCGSGTTCRNAPGTPALICMPIGAGTPIQPTLLPAYTACSTAGACASGTSCMTSMFTRAGQATGNLCTIACTSGNAAMCPGYVPGAAIQSVECVAPAGNPSLAQCMRLCNLANGNRDCAPYQATCSAVAMAAGTLSVCVP